MDPSLLVKDAICKNFTFKDSKLTKVINRMCKNETDGMSSQS